MQPNLFPDRRRDILLLIFSIFGIAILAGRGIFLVITGLTSFRLKSLNAQNSSIFDALSMFFCAILLLPLLVYCIRKLKGMEIGTAKLPPIKIWQAAALIGIWACMIILGSILNNLPNFGWLMALPFFLLGIVIPVAGLAWIAIGGIPAGSWRRLWAAFSIGMIGSTLGALVLEYSLVGIAAVAAGIVASTNPEWQRVFQQIKSQVTKGADIQSLLTTLAPYLTNPLFLVLALVFACGTGPDH